jgi:hypothetical protein
MMYLQLARNFDERDMPREAAWAYEVSLADPGADLDAFLDLVALYFSMCDTGYVASHHLDQRFSDVAYDRAVEVLNLAKSRFGARVEIDFWRLYIRERVLGETVTRDAYLKLAFTSGAALPYLPIFVASRGKEFREQVEPLIAASRFGRTARERYMRSFAR